MFRDRTEAGKALAKKLACYKNDASVIILGLPRGGVAVAAEVAKALHAPLDLLLVRKLGLPENPELAMGALALPSTCVLNDDIIKLYDVQQASLDRVIAREKTVLQERNALYRENRPPPEVRGKTVILVDDGIATGADMRAALNATKAQNPDKVIVAVPIAPEEALLPLRTQADAIFCLEKPSLFMGVGQIYENFEQVPDETVIAFMKDAKKRQSKDN
ncbi:MAG: phosphoribosyltransferase [Alphaproteobacteria bacterium]|nr:phosphoribosyltransferase [Alphaproteobacteria bacterium]